MMSRVVLCLAALPLLLGLMAGGAAAQIPLGGSVSYPDWYHLPHAAKADKVDDVKTFLAHGESPDALDSEGRTALSYAATSGNVEIVKLLIDGGARMDYRDKFGNIALHWAADGGHLDVMRMLLAAKAPVDIPNKQGITPLMLASGRGKVEAIRVLLEAGADPRKQDFTGRDAIGWAANYPAAARLLRDAKPK